MGLEIRQAQEHFYFGACVFLLLFTFSAGIGLSATNSLGTGLPLIISNVLTVVACTLLIHFRVVTFAQQSAAPQQQSTTTTV